MAGVESVRTCLKVHHVSNDAKLLIRTNMNQFPTECASLVSVNIVLVNCPSVVHSVFSFLV